MRGGGEIRYLGPIMATGHEIWLYLHQKRRGYKQVPCSRHELLSSARARGARGERSELRYARRRAPVPLGKIDSRAHKHARCQNLAVCPSTAQGLSAGTGISP